MEIIIYRWISWKSPFHTYGTLCKACVSE